eukprot:2156158-Alexandrium_andersonii.AAC.1
MSEAAALASFKKLLPKLMPLLPLLTELAGTASGAVTAAPVPAVANKPKKGKKTRGKPEAAP